MNRQFAADKHSLLDITLARMQLVEIELSDCRLMASVEWEPSETLTAPKVKPIRRAH